MTKQFLLLCLTLLAPHLHASEAAEWWNAVEKMRSVTCEEHLSALTRGHLVHREDGETFALDAQTIGDLDLKTLLFPLYADAGGEILGRARLNTMLRETSVDPEEIRLRREAVRELEENDALRFDIRAQLKQMEKWSNTDAATVQFISGQSQRPLGLVRDSIGAGILAVGAGGVIYVLYVHPDQLKQVLYWGALPIFFSTTFLKGLAGPLIWHRARHGEIKTAIAISQKVAASLAGAKSTRLREIAAVLREFDRTDYDSPANEIVRSYVNLQDGRVPSLLLNYSFLSAISMRHLNRKLDRHREHILRLFSALGEASAFSSIATYGVSNPGLTEPELLDADQPARIEIEGGHHPYVLKDSGQTSVPNDIHLSADAGGHRGMILTGINGGGKSTVMRMIASLALMAQMGSRVPAQRMRWTPAAIATNMAVTDSVKDRNSFFQAQVKRVAEMVESVRDEKNVLLIMDEIFTGTSPEERAAGERAILRYLEKHPGRVAILASHDRRLGALTERAPYLFNAHVGDLGEAKFVLQPGISRTRNALQVMSAAGLPEDLLALIREEMGDLVPSEPAR